MFAQWDLAVNDFLGIPRSGWGDGFPTIEIALAVLVLAWVFFVTLGVLTPKSRSDGK